MNIVEAKLSEIKSMIKEGTIYQDDRYKELYNHFKDIALSQGWDLRSARHKAIDDAINHMLKDPLGIGDVFYININ